MKALSRLATAVTSLALGLGASVDESLNTAQVEGTNGSKGRLNETEKVFRVTAPRIQCGTLRDWAPMH